MSEEVPFYLRRLPSQIEGMPDYVSAIPTGRATYPESIEEDLSSRSTGLGAYEDYLSYSPIRRNPAVEDTSDPFQDRPEYDPYFRYSENIPVPLEAVPDNSFFTKSSTRLAGRMDGREVEPVPFRYPDESELGLGYSYLPTTQEDQVPSSAYLAEPFMIPEGSELRARPSYRRQLENPLAEDLLTVISSSNNNTNFLHLREPGAENAAILEAYERLGRSDYQQEDLFDFFQVRERHHNLPENYLQTVGRLESSLNPFIRAYDDVSTAKGMYQYIGSTARNLGLLSGTRSFSIANPIKVATADDEDPQEEGYRGPAFDDDNKLTLPGYDLRTNPFASAEQAARDAVEATRSLKGVFGPTYTPQGSDLYIYHQRGSTEAPALFRRLRDRRGGESVFETIKPYHRNQNGTINEYRAFVSIMNNHPDIRRERRQDGSGRLDYFARNDKLGVDPGTRFTLADMRREGSVLNRISVSDFVNIWRDKYRAQERNAQTPSGNLARVLGLEEFVMRPPAGSPFERAPSTLPYIPPPREPQFPEERGFYQAFLDRLRGDVLEFKGTYGANFYEPAEGAYSPYIPEDQAALRDPRSTAIYGEDPTFGQRLVEMGYDPSLQGTPAGRPNLPTAQELVEARGDVLTSMSGAQQYGIDTQQRARNFFGTMGRLFGRQDEVARDDRNRASGLALMRQAGLGDADIAQLAATADELVLQQLQRVMEGVADPESGIGLDLYEDRSRQDRRRLRQERLARRRNRPQIEAEEGVGSLF